MKHPSLDHFLRSSKSLLTKGPVALIFVEDDTEVASTLRHHIKCGFSTVVVFMPDVFDVPADLASQIHRVRYDCGIAEQVLAAINLVNAAAATGCWLYYCYNAEYLFFPFCETRTVREMLTFHSEERRDAMLTYVIDLYAEDLEVTPNAVSVETACLDKSGYYAQSRIDPLSLHPRDRQLDFFGGIRWRFEEHIPPRSRKIDRISLFRAKSGLTLQPDYTFDDQEYNTYACPWHHNLTACVCSFRAAKALKRNPASRFSIPSFKWHNSTRFEWHSRQLLDLGLMESGQWF